MTDTCTIQLDELLATAQTWLGPTIDAECRRQDAGIIATTDIETLALARKLRLGAVQRASNLNQAPAPSAPGGGDAA